MSRLIQQINQIMQLIFGHVSELRLMTGPDLGIEFLQQRQAIRGDAHLHDAAVFRQAFAFDEFAFGEFIQHPRDIGCARHQARRQGEGRKSSGIFASQQPQDVVLLRSDIEALKQVIFQDPEPVVGPPEDEECFLRQRVKSPRAGRLGCL